MSFETPFRDDAEFRKLLVRDKTVNLTVAALELARDAYPCLEFSTALGWLDECAREVSSQVAGAQDDVQLLRALVGCLAGTHGLCGDRRCYEEADASYLNRVIETGRGIPISLSVLYIGLAERVGIALAGVCAPGHFLARLETSQGPLFIDAFSEGTIMNLDECVCWIGSLAGLSRKDAESTLLPAEPRAIIIRMLNNLKALHLRQSNWREAWLVQKRLMALKPASYYERRDLAYTSLKCGRHGQALDLLESCLESCPTKDRHYLVEQLAQAKSQIARAN